MNLSSFSVFSSLTWFPFYPFCHTLPPHQAGESLGGDSFFTDKRSHPKECTKYPSKIHKSELAKKSSQDVGSSIFDEKGSQNKKNISVPIEISKI